MKHYPHHIGDFDRATRHLTRIERSVYRDLIDLYYDTEAQLALDVPALCRKIVARSNEESTAVQQVLNEFFTETPTGWYHERCEEEIAAYHANTSQKALAGKASAEAKRLKKLHALNGESTRVEQPLATVEAAGNGAPTNHQPSTSQPSTSQDKEPRAPRKPVADAPRVLGVQDLVDEGVERQHAIDWLKVRKDHKAPLTLTAWDQVKTEATKAGLTPAEAVKTSAGNSWQGFKASWLANARASPGKASRHAGFDSLDYSKGVHEDGTLV